jgi:hypothetical protein
MSQSTIYQIINLETGRKYLGDTQLPLNKVWKEHIKQSLHSSIKPLHKEMRKYGNHRFKIVEVYECNTNELEEKKQYYIERLNAINIEDYDKYQLYDKPIIIEPGKERKPLGFQIADNRGNGKKNAIPIMGLSITTGEEVYWDSIKEATISVCGDESGYGNIIRAMNNGYKAYGYRWKRVNNRRLKKPIKAIHKVTWQEHHFESCAEAIRQVHGNSKGDGLYKALKSNGRYTWKGFIWKYL